MNRSLDTVVYSLVLGSALALTGVAVAQGATDWVNNRLNRPAVVRLDPVTVTVSDAAFEAVRAESQQMRDSQTVMQRTKNSSAAS